MMESKKKILSVKVSINVNTKVTTMEAGVVCHCLLEVVPVAADGPQHLSNLYQEINLNLLDPYINFLL